MSNEENHSREQELRKRIASLVRANDQARKQQLNGDELENLKSAAGRLDQMLQASAEADQQALRTAASKLDQLLTDIRKGKDLSNVLKRRGERKDSTAEQPTE